ncbi:MAG: tail fiber domain-containing protein [Chthoniobacterales bacterium]
MYLANKIIRTISLVGACALAVTAARAVSPPPDGGYDNFNTAEGQDALFNLTTGFENTAIGYNALYFNTTGAGNTANGYLALGFNTTGSNNTANGYSVLFLNETGNANTACGLSALYNNTSGNNNTAIGYIAGSFNKTGNNNIALGAGAGSNLTSGDNNIDIGNSGDGGESGKIRLGTIGSQTATFIAGIRETPLAKGLALAVGINADGQLGVRASSARFKEAIKPMNKASEAILSLRPVSFRYRKALDPKSAPQFGLIAEEVAKVDPDLVVCDEKGKPFSVRYEEVNAMLLNEFLKEHRKVQGLEETVAQLKSAVAQQKDLQATVAHLQSALEKQASQIQKVSDQVAASKTAPPMIVTNR